MRYTFFDVAYLSKSLLVTFNSPWKVSFNPRLFHQNLLDETTSQLHDNGSPGDAHLGFLLELRINVVEDLDLDCATARAPQNNLDASTDCPSTCSSWINTSGIRFISIRRGGGR